MADAMGLQPHHRVLGLKAMCEVDRNDADYYVRHRYDRAPKPSRNKINCTAAPMEVDGEYFWYSHLWSLIDDDGRWLTR